MRLRICLITMISIVALQNGWGKTQAFANSDNIRAFITLLQEVDLNAETHRGFTITEAEYKQLVEAWQALSQCDRNQIMVIGPTSSWWSNTCAMALLYDLNNKAEWENHIENVENLGRRGLALTISLQNNPVHLTIVRNMLVDLLRDGPSMVSDGRLKIADAVKTQAEERVGYQARQRLEKWERLINRYQNQSVGKKIKAVNAFFNKEIKPIDDRGSISSFDYWQSPIETLVRGIGDCDDFAMAKYISLRLLSIPANRLHVAAFMNSRGGHAVLFFYPKNDNNPLVLDNLPFESPVYKGHLILKLTTWASLTKMKLLYEVNEDLVREYDEKGRIYQDPIYWLPKFGVALINSQRVLPHVNSSK